MRRFSMTAVRGLVALTLVLGLTGMSAHEASAASGYQWASCSSGSRSFAARLYWNSSGYLYKMEFRSSSIAVKQVDLWGMWSAKPMWQRQEAFTSFPRSTSYSARTVRSGWPWGWHTHWSGSYDLYQSKLTVYASDGNWYPECTIHFYENADRFR